MISTLLFCLPLGLINKMKRWTWKSNQQPALLAVAIVAEAAQRKPTVAPKHATIVVENL